MTKPGSTISRILVWCGVATLVVATAACGSTRHVATRTDPTTSTIDVTSSTAPDSSTTSVGETSTTTSGQPATNGNQPLWPFRTSSEAETWQASYRSGGSQPWHLSAGETALSFARGYLGYAEITTVISTRTDGGGAHVSVGYLDDNGGKHTAAVVHLFRWGSGSDQPWEVAGTDDTDFSLTTPPYGSAAHSPVTVGGKITGVDESIKVLVHQISSSSAIGTFCCLPAGGSGTDWHTTVSFTGATDAVVTISASTGGHLQGVERFTVTAMRTAP